MSPRTVFETTERFQGAAGPTRRMLALVEFDRSRLLKFGSVFKTLKMGVPVSPVWEHDCWAHVGCPSLKIAFLCREYMAPGRITNLRNRWGAHGWNLLSITTMQFDSMSSDTLARHLKEALKLK